MRHRKIIHNYTIVGLVLGSFLPFLASYLELRRLGIDFSLANFIDLQSSDLLLWFIDLAPLLLGFVGYFFGLKQANLKEIIEKNEETIEAKTEDLRKKNRILRKEIDEKRITEKQMTLAKNEAERAKKAEELFLANMSHELRTPLNGVTGFTTLLLGTQLDTTQNEYVNTIKTSANHLLAIINDILEISKIKAGEIEFEENPISPTKVFANVVNTFKIIAAQKHLSVFEEIDRKLPPYILGDQTRILQILLNLVSNAVKFTHEGSVTIRAILEKEFSEKVSIRFEVEDTGIGIPDDRLQAIFDKFKQAEVSTTRDFGGTGLGLSICKDMVELQGGSLQVKSQLGKGSLFTFSLTFKIATQIVPKEALNGAIEIKDIGSLKILLVEDNKINVKLAENVFKKWGNNMAYKVASNGKEAINWLEKEEFQVVLMDLQMPIMDGFEATKYIRTEMKAPVKDIPIIALTADVMASEKAKAFRAGINDYITKPFDANKLFSTIAQQVATKA